jgi:2-oxoglutarate ferredoxin oxidoreductase subunit alpha
LRSDVTFLGVPFAKLCAEAFKDSRERTLMKNIAYVGALASLLSIDMDVVGKMLEEKFSKKPALRSRTTRPSASASSTPGITSRARCRSARDDGRHEGLHPHRRQHRDGPRRVYAGATVAAWYPITPSTSVLDAFKVFCERTAPTRPREEELLHHPGRGRARRRGHGDRRLVERRARLHLHRGPGHLAHERADRPRVLRRDPHGDRRRAAGGPSTGMPTRTQQGDILLCAYASHGDTKHICLYPANPEECFHFAVESFDLAERFQTPVFMLTDLDIGMNDWVVPKLTLGRLLQARSRPRAQPRGDREDAERLLPLLPEDELGVAARTLPGVHPKGAFFTRGSGHNKLGKYTETRTSTQEVMDRLARKHRAAKAFVPPALIEKRDGATFGIITVGGCDRPHARR